MRAARALIDRTPVAARADDALADARAGGMDEASIAALERALGRGKVSDDFDGVWPDHVTAVRAAEAAGTQWRTSLALEDGDKGGIALVTRWLGLDYAACAACWSALGLVVSGDDFRTFQRLEGFLRTLLNGGELVEG